MAVKCRVDLTCMKTTLVLVVVFAQSCVLARGFQERIATANPKIESSADCSLESIPMHDLVLFPKTGARAEFSDAAFLTWLHSNLFYPQIDVVISLFMMREIFLARTYHFDLILKSDVHLSPFQLQKLAKTFTAIHKAAGVSLSSSSFQRDGTNVLKDGDIALYAVGAVTNATSKLRLLLSKMAQERNLVPIEVEKIGGEDVWGVRRWMERIENSEVVCQVYQALDAMVSELKRNRKLNENYKEALTQKRRNEDFDLRVAPEVAIRLRLRSDLIQAATAAGVHNRPQSSFGLMRTSD